MSIQNQYQVVFNTASGTAIVQGKGNVTMHTINFPKATAGLVFLATNLSSGTSIVWTLPIATIGSLRFDCGFPDGLAVQANSADAYAVTFQTP